MKTIKEAIASSKDLKFFFDLHRDSQKRKYTTIDIDGKSYAQVYFIIGHKNPNWEKNEAFATKIHEALDKKYPGISRGIWGKTAASGDANTINRLPRQCADRSWRRRRYARGVLSDCGCARGSSLRHLLGGREGELA